MARLVALIVFTSLTILSANKFIAKISARNAVDRMALSAREAGRAIA